jgi:hypothetical protein
MYYAIKVTCKESKAYDNSIITRDGAVVWVTTGEYGATSINFGLNHAGYSLMVFDTREKAQTFADNWKGHPWYYKPKNVEVVEVTPLYERITGWEEA